MACLAVCGGTNPRVVLPGHLPAITAKSASVGRLDAATELNLSIFLPLRNEGALTNFLNALYDPANPLYRQYLTSDQFDARFGPTAEDYQAVMDWAARNHFVVTARHNNRRLLQVRARAEDLERALQVTLRTYQHPAEARTFYGPDVEPSIEAGVPILSFGGLDTLARPRPRNLHRAPIIASTGGPAPKNGSGPNGTLGGWDYRAAYVPGVALTGTGQSVGLVEFDGYYASDITSYESQMGLPNVPLQIITMDSFNGIPTTGSTSANSEVALDIEMALSMAPGLSKIVVFESNPDPALGIYNHVLQAMATNTYIKQLSCSWDAGTISSAQRKTMENYFQQFASQGQSFFNASGDNGAVNGSVPPPDDDPYITEVGGTTLATAGPNGPWLSEIVWNSQEGPGYNATGGGISGSYPLPGWQKNISMTANHGSTTYRNYPDVAMVADDIFIVADNGQNETTGGTSASAPLWAGFMALVNQQAVAAGKGVIGFPNPALYQIATNSGYLACFNDITTGNNTNLAPTQFLAVPGYDLCTGWGSPAGGSLILALVQPDGFLITPARGPVANGAVGGPFSVTSQTFSLTNAGISPLTWALGSTSTWLTASFTSGTLAPGTATNLAVTINAAATQLSAGVATANVWFTNLVSGLAQLRQFSLQAGQDLVEDGGFESGDLTYWVLAGPDAGIYTNNLADDGSVTGTGYSPYSGNWYAALGQVGSLAYLSQTLPTRPGQFYEVSFWFENPSGSTPNRFVFEWITNSVSPTILYDQSNVGSFGWTKQRYVVQAGSTSTKLQFGVRHDNDFFCLDAVSVVPVPMNVTNYNVSVSSLPLGGGTASGTGTFSPGGTCTASAVANPGYIFANWTEAGIVVSSTNSYTFAVTNDTTLVANFLPAASVVVTPSPSGGGTVGGGGTFATGSRITVSAARNNGYLFVDWTQNGRVVSFSNSFSFTVSSNLTLVANFAPAATITLGGSPVGAGTVSGAGTFLLGSKCTVTAAPGAGYVFADWSRNGQLVGSATNYTFLLTSNVNLVANFRLVAQVTVSASPAAGGRVTGGGTFLGGEICKVSATANPGFLFTRWTEGGAGAGTAASFSFVVTNNRALVANFADVKSPSLAIVSPLSGQQLTGATCVVTGTASDNVAVSEVLCQVGAGPWVPAVGTSQWTATLPLAPGTNQVRAYATDTSGNHSRTNSISLSLDASFPLAITGQGTVQVAGGGKSWRISNATNEWLIPGASYRATAAAASGFRFAGWSGAATGTNPAVQFTMAPELALAATFVDTKRPICVITYPGAKATITNSMITLTGGASDNVGVTNVWCFINGTNWAVNTSNHWTNWTVVNAGLITGTNTAAAFAVDAAGNASLTNTIKFVHPSR